MITARQYIDEVKLRLLRNNVNADFDDMTILSQINRARRNVVSMTVDIFPEFFINKTIITVSEPYGINYEPTLSTNKYGGGEIIVHRYNISEGDFIKPLEVWLDFIDIVLGVRRVWQVRIVTRKEFHNTLKHSMNAPLPSSMVCCFEQNITNGSTSLIIGFDGTNFKEFIYNPACCDLHVYYFCLPVDLELYSDSNLGSIVYPEPFSKDMEYDIPPHLQELVILQAILYLLISLKQQGVYQRFKDEFNIVWSMIYSNKEIEKYQKETLLPSKKPIEGVNFPINLLNLSNEGGE